MANGVSATTTSEDWDGIQVTEQRLRRFTTGVLCAVGVSAADAETIAWSLVEADLRGHSSHGVIRLPTFVRRIQEGAHDVTAVPTVVQQGPISAVVDAGNGFGQVAVSRAIDIALEKASKGDLALVAVRRSQNFGSLGPFVERISSRGMIGFLCTNGAPAMAPPNGVRAVLGTNPLAISFPWKQPITLDMATSVVARDKITLALRAGKPIPEGWALDEEGNPTTDPTLALKGSLLPIASYKGFGLALAVEVLAAGLSDSEVGPDTGWLYDVSKPQGVGHLVGAIRLEAFLPRDRFEARITRLVSAIRSCGREGATNGISLPGEPEHNCRRQRLAEGIPLPSAVTRELVALGERLGVKWED